ncbi:MAG: hypothetical protein HN337_01735 [Deltaproteobacteria bacterium]|nr:hypothetical protein [Deltaproteobacteria bacterium]
MSSALTTFPASIRMMPVDQARGLILNGVTSNLTRYAHQVNYPVLLGSHPVLFCGEYHSDLGAKHDLIRNMPLLRQCGVTHLGMEMFFNDDGIQAELDTYFERRTEETFAPIRAALYYYGNQYVCTPDYERLVATAVENGVRVVGIDSHPSNRGLANEAWADKITEILSADAAARMVVYGGTMHMGYHPFAGELIDGEYDPVNLILGRRGVFGTVIRYVGGTHLDDAESRYDQVTQAVLGNRMGTHRFMLALGRPKPEDLDTIRASHFDHPWPDIFVHTPLHESPPVYDWDHRGINRRVDLGRLGLPDDAYWENRWRRFLQVG